MDASRGQQVGERCRARIACRDAGGLEVSARGAEHLPQLLAVTSECAERTAREVEAVEIARAKAQLKVALLAALEAPGGRIERIARQLLAD